MNGQNALASLSFRQPLLKGPGWLLRELVWLVLVRSLCWFKQASAGENAWPNRLLSFFGHLIVTCKQTIVIKDTVTLSL